MKKFMFIFCVVVITAVIFVGGFVAGMTLDLMNSMFQVSTFDKSLCETSSIFMRVKLLDEEKINDVKMLQNAELGGQIVSLTQMLEDCQNPESKKHAQNLLARIAEHRQKYPPAKIDSKYIEENEFLRECEQDDNEQ